MRLKLSAVLFCSSLLMLISVATMIPSVSAQIQPTAIPILPEETEDSAAPLLPTIATTAEASPVDIEQADPDPEATERVERPDEDDPDNANDDNSLVCPLAVQDAFTATEILCSESSTGNGCIGNGTVNSTVAGATNPDFAQAGDQVAFDSLETITLTSGQVWTVVKSDLILLSSPSGTPVNTVLYAYGNLRLENRGRVAGQGAQNGTVLAQRGMNVRRTPSNDGVAVWQLQPGQQIEVTGITADREWLRMVIPNEFEGTGWVYTPYIEVEGGVDSLTVVDINSPRPDLTPPQFAPGRSFVFSSRPRPDGCDDSVPDSGLLIQTPSGNPEAVRLELNQVELQINGTIFVQAQAEDEMTVAVLEGQTTAIIGEERQSANANEHLLIALDDTLNPLGTVRIESFDSSNLEPLPIRLLPRQILLGTVDLGFEEPTPVNDAPVNADTSAATDDQQSSQVTTACTLTANDDIRNIRSGPSTQFPVIDTLEANRSTVAVGQTIGELNLVWFLTERDGWVRIDTVVLSGDCSSVPEVAAPALPAATATPIAEQAALSASNLPEITCDNTTITGSATSDGSDLGVRIGGTWTARAGTTVSFTTQGGMLRPELGDYIQMIGEDGTIIARSGENRSLTTRFEQNRTFSMNFSAANGDTVIMAVRCN